MRSMWRNENKIDRRCQSRARPTEMSRDFLVGRFCCILQSIQEIHKVLICDKEGGEKKMMNMHNPGQDDEDDKDH